MAKKKLHPFSVAKAEDSSGFLLWQVTNLWQRELRKALDPFGITHAQFVLLASTYWLTISGDEVTQMQLSKHTKIDPMTTSTVLRTLQKKGLLQRKEHPVDTRAKVIALTEAGKKLTKLVVPVVETFDETFFAGLTQKHESFNRQLQKLLDNSVE